VSSPNRIIGLDRAGPTLIAIVGMYDGLACASQGPLADRVWLESRWA
jgi:hypothetical protein